MLALEAHFHRGVDLQKEQTALMQFLFGVKAS